MIVLEYVFAQFEEENLCAGLGSLTKLSTSILYKVSVHRGGAYEAPVRQRQFVTL